MGYTIIALSAGVDEKGILQAIKQNDFSDLPYGGYLCNIPVDQWEGKFKNVLPDCLTGKDFLKKYSRTIDHVTVVNETVRYEVEACTAHPIYENERVHLFLEHVLAINNWDDANLNKTRLTKMGELMYKAHESYSGCGLGSERTDENRSAGQRESPRRCVRCQNYRRWQWWNSLFASSRATRNGRRQRFASST